MQVLLEKADLEAKARKKILKQCVELGVDGFVLLNTHSFYSKCKERRLTSLLSVSYECQLGNPKHKFKYQLN